MRPRRPPRLLTADELDGLLRVADSLIPEVGDMPAASRAPDYETWLLRSLVARTDAFDAVVDEAARLRSVEASELGSALRRLADERPAAFKSLSSVLAGAYLMVPEVRMAIGYPGQERKHPRFDEAAEEIMDGILDPVLERGSIYTPTPTTRA